MRITLCGAFGLGHARDQALKESLQDIGHAAGLSLELDLLGGRRTPEAPEVVGIGSRDQARREALKSQPILVTGHGVIEPSTHSLLARCSPLLRSAPFSALFGAAVELGVSYPFVTRMQLRPILKRMRHLFVSDVYSKELLRQLVSRAPTEVIGDPCLSLVSSQDRPEELAGLNRYIAVALAPRWSRAAGWHRWISRRLVELGERLDARIVFVPIAVAKEDDCQEAERVVAQMRKFNDELEVVCIQRLLPPREMASLFKGAILTIGMRLHACVLSYAQQTPFVGLLHHPKLRGFAATVNCPRNIFPQIELEPLTAHPYGYDFEELPMEERSLVQTALNALEGTDFSSLERFKSLQRDSLLALLGQPGVG